MGLKKYHNNLIGENSRLDEIQASFLSAKLEELNKNISRRRVLAKRYIENLSEMKKLSCLKIESMNLLGIYLL